MLTFNELGLDDTLSARLAELGLTKPTPIQSKAIPFALNGHDVMGLAQTGTGKTAGFGLPLIHQLTRQPQRAPAKGAFALVLAPTRELARQISESLKEWGEGARLRVCLVTGGASLNRQSQFLERGAHILVATPGRLIDLLDRRAVQLGDTRFLVLDEADQMLDMGFIHALRQIAPLLPAERQTMLFSATMPKQMNELAQQYLNKPKRIEAARPGQTADKIAQSVHYIAQGEKTSLLIELLDAHRDELALVFSRTKHGAERLMKQLDRKGFAAASIHGNKSQGQRDRAIAAFKAGETRVLVATDVAARGIDIPGVAFVYNYDLPNVAENYVHRIGRTARAGASGQAVALCSPDEMEYLLPIEKLVKQELEVASGTRWMMPAGESKKPGKGRPNRRRGGSGGGQRGGQRGRRAA